MEYADSGTLRNYLKEKFDNLTWNDKFNLSFQLACVVSCLHDEGIVHLDLVIHLLYCKITYLINLITLFIMFKNSIPKVYWLSKILLSYQILDYQEGSKH